MFFRKLYGIRFLWEVIIKIRGGYPSISNTLSIDLVVAPVATRTFSSVLIVLIALLAYCCAFSFIVEVVSM